MFTTTIPNYEKIAAIKVLAYLPNGNSPSLLIEISEGKFAFITPPRYEIKTIEPDYIGQAAIEKYGYIPFEQPKVIANPNELFSMMKIRA